MATGQLEECVTIVHSVQIRRVPWELTKVRELLKKKKKKIKIKKAAFAYLVKCADGRLIRALGTFARVRRLERRRTDQPLSLQKWSVQKKSDALRKLRMADCTHYFFTREEAPEAGRIRIGVWHDCGRAAMPDQTLRARKQVLEKRVLAAELNVDMSVAKARIAARLEGAVDALHSVGRVPRRKKLGVAIHGLCRRSFHDDVNGTAFVRRYQFCIASEKLANLGLRN